MEKENEAVRIDELDAYFINNPEMKNVVWKLIEKGLKGDELKELFENIKFIFGDNIYKIIRYMLLERESALEEIDSSNYKNKEYLKSFIFTFADDLFKMFALEVGGPSVVRRINEYYSIDSIRFLVHRVDDTKFEMSFNMRNIHSFLEYFIDQYKNMIFYNLENDHSFDLSSHKRYLDETKKYFDSFVEEIESLEEESNE